VILPRYQRIARTLIALSNCRGRLQRRPTGAPNARRAKAWIERHTERLESTALPSGSGLDLGPRIDIERSRPDRIVITNCDYHHMNEHGYYTRWTKHEVIITPSLAFGFDIRVTGRDYKDIKEYIAETFTDHMNHGVSRDLV